MRLVRTRPPVPPTPGTRDSTFTRPEDIFQHPLPTSGIASSIRVSIIINLSILFYRYNKGTLPWYVH